MNATFRVAVKACLLTAVSGVLMNQVVGLSAQDVGGEQSDGSTAPTIRRTAGYQGTATTAPQSSSPQSSSAVQQQLQELYRKNGREMPSMNMEDLPNVQPQAPASPATGQYAPAKPMNSSAAKSGSPAAKSQKPNFFERLFRIGRARKKPAVTAQPTPPAAPVAQPRPSAPPQIASRSAPVSQPLVTSVTPGPRAAAQPPVREPTLLDGSGAAMSRANRTPASASRPTQRSGISPPVTDDEESTSDSESLDLDQDEQAQNSDEAPQILSSQTANGPADSPYSGHKLSPLEMEEKAASSPIGDGESAESADSTTDDDDDAADAEKKPARHEPAPLAPADDTTPASSPEQSKDDDPGLKDKELDLEEDEEPLTLPADQPAKPAEKPIEPAAEKPALSATERPAKEKVLAKPATEKESQKPAVPALVKGFRGYCPVALKDNRKLVEAKPEIESTYRDKVYTFSSYQAKEAFDLNPRKYVPAGEGADVVCRTAGETGVEGSLEHAAWYRGRLYLFSCADTRREFVETPSKFVAED